MEKQNLNLTYQTQVFAQRVLSLKDEQERVQKKTFTNWMNTYLKQKQMKVENLFEDIKDGVYLLSLLEVLSGESLQMEKGPRLKRVHHVSNISTALKFLETKKIKLVNINVSDIADGKPSIVLGLIWTIILYFQIEDTFAQATEGDDRPLSALEKFRKNAKKALLAWTGNAITKRYGIEIRDFGKSWRDGLAFNAIVHTIRPDLIDFESAKNQTARVNLENAFSVAENQLGIARLLDPEDVDVEKPDEKSIMTYVAQFLKAYPEAGEDPALGKKKKDPASQEMADYTDLMNWLATEAEEVLQIVDEPVTDRQQEYMDYLAFKTEMDRREKVYDKLAEKCIAKKALKINDEMWKDLDTKWKHAARRTRMWLWKLDASLPGRLGKFGDWLNQGEEVLAQEPEPPETHDHLAQEYARLCQESKVYFKDIDEWKTFFYQVKKVGKYEGEFLPPPQLESLATRLTAMQKEVPRREKRLDFEEYKHRVLAIRETAEERLQIWAQKLGYQDEVEEVMMDYENFVNKEQLFPRYDQASQELAKRAEIYRRVAGKEEAEKLGQFLSQQDSDWKKISAEIKNLQSMFENGIDNWRNYNACFDSLMGWITAGENVLNLSVEEKQAHFSDLPEFEEKHKLLNESANFLIQTTKDPIAAEIKENVMMVDSRFKDLVDAFNHFQQVEVIGRARQDYSEGVERISGWLKNTEDLLAQDIPCVHTPLKEHLQDLDTLGTEVPDIENDFKTTTKTAQSLVKDSEPEVVTEMLQTLNVQKEVIVRLRKEIPERIKYLKAVLPNVASLETGISDMNLWLDKGESVLRENRMEGNQQAAEETLERHKAFFQETTYQKSIIESKNKVHQKVSSTKPKLKNVNFDPVDEPMAALNQRFQQCITNAKDWEKKLENLSRLWRVFQQKEHAVNAWLQQARAVLDDGADDPESLIRKHKQFFNRVDKKLLDDCLKAGNDILGHLEKKDQGELQQTMKDIQDRWQEIQVLAPIRLIKIEFCIPEDKFVQSMDSAEKTLAQEQQALKKNENVRAVLQKHKQTFNEGQFRPTCIKCLESMQTMAREVNKQDKKDNELQDRYEDHKNRWDSLVSAMDSICTDLKQLPERWKDYNQRLDELNANVANVQDLMQQLQNENLTNEEYKDLQAKYQKALRNMEKYKDDAKWLQDNLEELLEDSPEADKSREKKRLDDLLSKFKGLQPNLDKVSDKSAIFSKAYDYKDGLERKAHWLDETQKLVKDEPCIDGLEDARAYLQEHETVMQRLESERPTIQAEIEAGRRLQRERNAPTFVSKTVDDLDRKWKDTNDLAKQKHAKLKQKVKEWEQYEGEKQQLLQYLKKAEAELEKPPATTGQELAQKDYQSKQELQKTLNKLKSSLSDMQKLNAALCEGASRERKGPLKGEMSDIDKRLDNVSVRLNAKLADLEATIAKWTEYYKRLNQFCNWLNEKEAKLNEVYENKTDSPETQLGKAQAITTEVSENHITLENLEKDARGMSQNFRSRETSALKTKLASVRRQWESLCSRAKDRSSALTGSVAHWQMHQNLKEQLMPWILKAEKYCATELPKCASMEEAKELHDLHQAFLNECEENFPVFEKLNTEAGYLMEQPNMASDMEALQKRWNDIIGCSEERSHKVDKALGAWSAFDNELNNFDEVLEKFQKKLEEEPNMATTDVQVLEHELALSKNLQEEIKSQKPHLTALQRQYEQVKQHASPEGAKALKSKLDAVNAAYCSNI
ncbi:hypothetical protein FSP39_003323 [Pinctada imbricata]|uniref:Calponin-homology (CH) domain-containing protein n=1 Tax=Pinctada imbricata TaxID=66713 RepID=A0AA89BVW4_PINIB|nr:hypothetical protein FSP39_003323 [Pinctada imbricata]